MPDDVPPLAVTRDGAGPPLLLLHGLASDRQEFTRVLAPLTARYDVLAVDLPGHGASEPLPPARPPSVQDLTDAVEATLDRVGIGAPHVLGVSLGGRVGLELARRGRALSVVAVAPTGLASPPERAYQLGLLGVARLGYAALDRAGDGLLRLAPARAAALIPLRARGWRTSRGEAAALVHAFAHTRDYWRLLRHAVLPEATWDYHDVRCPVVLVQGTSDVLALGQVVRLLPLVPGARFRLLPGAGHSAVGDLPREVVRLVDEAVAAAGPSAGT